jgi:hypothetical protein
MFRIVSRKFSTTTLPTEFTTGDKAAMFGILFTGFFCYETSIPRAPLRALNLGVSSWLKTTHPASVRDEEISRLRKDLESKALKNLYIVVTGEEGIGKRKLINTALSRKRGVVHVNFQAGETSTSIMQKVMNALTGNHSQVGICREVPTLFFYRLFFRESPIIVLHADERRPGEDFASITGAVRTLSEDYKLRVLVEGKPDSLDISLFRTMREVVINVEPLTRTDLVKIPVIKELYEKLAEKSLDDVVFKVLGGVPSINENFALELLLC